MDYLHGTLPGMILHGMSTMVRIWVRYQVGINSKTACKMVKIIIPPQSQSTLRYVAKIDQNSNTLHGTCYLRAALCTPRYIMDGGALIFGLSHPDH